MFFRREIQKRKTARKRALSVSEKLLYFRLFFQPFILHLSTRFSCVPPRFFAGFRRLSIKRTAAYAEKRQKCGFFSAFFSAEMLFETRFLSRHAAFFSRKDYLESCFLPLFLLLFKTFLPPFVDILSLNPCTLLLCLFLGWYVLFMIVSPYDL